MFLAACLVGYVWIFINYIQHTTNIDGITVCVIKNTTSLPCPACGSTRSLLSIVKGDFFNAIAINPLGLVLAVVLLILPFWLLYDVSKKKETLLLFYIKAEKKLKKKQLAIPLILLIIVNWVWNIYKGL